MMTKPVALPNVTLAYTAGLHRKTLGHELEKSPTKALFSTYKPNIRFSKVQITNLYTKGTINT